LALDAEEQPTIREVVNEQVMMTLEEVSPTLLWVLRKLGEEYGPMGVALVAARLVGIDAVRERLENLP